MSRLHRQRSFARAEKRDRIIEIERAHQTVNRHTVSHYYKHEGLMWDDAEKAAAYELEIDRLQALDVAVGLSEREHAKLVQTKAELQRHVSAAKCHAQRQAVRARNSQRTDCRPVGV